MEIEVTSSNLLILKYPKTIFLSDYDNNIINQNENRENKNPNEKDENEKKIKL